jgi:hypothetical protein
MEIDDAMECTESERKLRKKASIYAKATFATNLVSYLNIPLIIFFV